MHAGQRYSIKEFILWTRRDIYILIALALIPTTLYHLFGMEWLAIPWVPVAMVGTAAAFIIGFRNTQTYNRLWEARQLWGSIVNASRTWGIMTRDFIRHDDAAHKELIYRHCAWLTALRFQLRQPQVWENTNRPNNKEYRQLYSIPEWETNLDEVLAAYLTKEELHYVLGKKNRAAQLIAMQSKHLAEIKAKGQLGDFEYVELEKCLADFYEQQGKCERIKNFPYPRQFSSINYFFVWLFSIMLPFGLLNEFQKLGEHFVWLTIPFSVIVSWVFTAMEQVGQATENPFEGGANDVPMAALARNIEIDLRDMLDEKDLPPPLTPVNKILM
jgi:putative membrane protein